MTVNRYVCQACRLRISSPAPRLWHDASQSRSFHPLKRGRSRNDIDSRDSRHVRSDKTHQRCYASGPPITSQDVHPGLYGDFSKVSSEGSEGKTGTSGHRSHYEGDESHTAENLSSGRKDRGSPSKPKFARQLSKWKPSSRKQTTEEGFKPHQPSLASMGHATAISKFLKGKQSVPPYSRDPISLTIGTTQLKLSPLALRDMCSCQHCVDPSSGQKLYNTVDVPGDVRAKSVNHTDGNVNITWENDLPQSPPDHVTTIKMKTLNEYLARPYQPSSKFDPALVAPEYWKGTFDTYLHPDIPYDKYMTDDQTLYTALHQLHSTGLLFLTGVPEAESSVSTIAERIGPLQDTFYGRTWDVRSVPDAKNVAYTSQDLGFHMDLLYLSQPPFLQFLHCIRASDNGGASVFTDAYAAAQKLWEQDPAAVGVLNKPHSIGFHYDHKPDHYYAQSRAVIELQDMQGPSPTRWAETRLLIDSMSWSPPFQMPFVERPVSGRLRKLAFTRSLEQWHAAARKLNRLFQDPQSMYNRMMKPGECVIFNNRRVLHARTAFEVGDIGKERWFRGAYLEKSPFLSKLTVLGQQYAKKPTGLMSEVDEKDGEELET